MNRKRGVGSWLARPRLPWLGAPLALALAVVVSLLVTQLLVAPGQQELRDLAAALAFSGATTLAAGYGGLRLAAGRLRLSIRRKAFVGTVVGSGVALLNVFIMAWLMLLSTAHDLKLFVALLVFSGAITVVFSLWVASLVTRGLQAVAATVGALAGGNYGSRVVVAGGDEVAQLAADVNRLAHCLQASDEQRQALERERRELTAAISHDLRTPLASVQAMVEALDDRLVEDAAEVTRYYATIRHEVERLDRMIQDLFELAQMDAGVVQLPKRRVALQEIVTDIVDAMQAQARRGAVSLSAQVAGAPSALLLDGQRIERALANLVRNALEHTPAGGRVELRLAETDGWVEVRVSDTGEGIAAADLAHIWNRFYRAQQARGRSSHGGDGAGLGLAIARAIVELHQGSLTVQSALGHGSVFTLRLPATPSCSRASATGLPQTAAEWDARS